MIQNITAIEVEEVQLHECRKGDIILIPARHDGYAHDAAFKRHELLTIRNDAGDTCILARGSWPLWRRDAHTDPDIYIEPTRVFQSPTGLWMGLPATVQYTAPNELCKVTVHGKIPYGGPGKHMHLQCHTRVIRWLSGNGKTRTDKAREIATVWDATKWN